jgi:ABC-type transport system involved in multi-copper enzyme maturation permease subunit
MLPYLRSELYRLQRRRMLIVLLVLTVVIPIVIYALIYTSTQAQLQAVRSGQFQQPPGQAPITEESVRTVLATLRPDRAPEFAFGMAGVVGVIFATILAGSVIGNEFGWATVRTLMAHGGRRASFLFAKLVALVLATAVLFVVGTIGTFIGSYAIGIVAGLDLALSGDLLARIAGYFARALVATAPYITFAVLMGVLARSAAAGIAFGLVLFFGESLLAQLAIQLNPDLRPLFDAGIARNVSTVTRTPSTGPGPAVRLPSTVEFSFALSIIALYVVAFLSLAVHRFAKRDLTLA